MTSLIHGALEPSQVRSLIAQAGRAPSVHNTQPWRFEWDGQSFRLSADTQRGLTVSDPESRELAISCGAALFNLRLALRNIERAGVVELMPDQRDPRMLARIFVKPGDPPTTVERELFKAVGRRHTRRGGFDGRAVSPALAVALQDAAYAESGSLHYVTDPGPRRSVLHLAQEAEQISASDPRVAEETEQWTPAPTSSRRDGVPSRSYPPVCHPVDIENLPGRDFDLGRHVGSAEGDLPPSGSIAVLLTDGDSEADWLRAGQALESVLVTAAAQWAFASLHSRVCEVPRLRAELRRQLGLPAYPHILLRFGYADTMPRTPRRAVEDILDVVPDA